MLARRQKEEHGSTKVGRTPLIGDGFGGFFAVAAFFIGATDTGALFFRVVLAQEGVFALRARAIFNGLVPHGVFAVWVFRTAVESFAEPSAFFREFAFITSWAFNAGRNGFCGFAFWVCRTREEPSETSRFYDHGFGAIGAFFIGRWLIDKSDDTLFFFKFAGETALGVALASGKFAVSAPFNDQFLLAFGALKFGDSFFLL